MTDFPDTPRMDKMGAGVYVSNDAELANVWCELLKPSARKKALKDCHEYFAVLGGAAEKTWDEIEACMLDRIGGKG